MANVIRLGPEYIPNPTIGRPVANGYLYVGEQDTDPTIVGNQKTVSALQENGSTVVLSQPISLSGGGVPEYNGSPVTLLVDGSYSLRVDDRNNSQVYYVPKNAELSSVESVDSIADLRAITETPADGDVLPALGYYAPGDGGGGLFYWDATSTDTDNNGTIIKVTAIATGRWKRIYDGNNSNIMADWFGIVGDGVVDDYSAIQQLIDDFAGETIQFDSLKTYYIGTGLVVNDNSTHLFTPARATSLFVSDQDIYMYTIDDCRYAQTTNIGFSNTHPAPTKANILLAGRAKDSQHWFTFSSGNKYGVLVDGAQGSVPGGIFYNKFDNITIDASTDECIYFTDYAGMNENWFINGRLASPASGKFIRTTGNNNQCFNLALEDANSADYTKFAITDNGDTNIFAFCRHEHGEHGILVDSVLTDESKGTVIFGNYWACNTVRVAVNDGIAKSDTSGKDSTFQGILKGSFVTSTVDVLSASGQPVLSVDSTDNYYIGQAVSIDLGNSPQEWHIIDSIQDGISLTFIANLVNSHDVGVAVRGANAQHGMQTWNQGNTDALEFYKAGVSSMRIDSQTVMVGNNTETPGIDALHVKPKEAQTQYNIKTQVDSTNTRQHIRFENPNGVVGSISTDGSVTSYNISSDYRLKHNVRDIKDAIHKISLLNPVTYEFKSDPGNAVDGFIAHELKSIIPAAVTGEKDGVDKNGNPIYQGVDLSKIIPLIVKAIHEILGKIDASSK